MQYATHMPDLHLRDCGRYLSSIDYVRWIELVLVAAFTVAAWPYLRLGFLVGYAFRGNYGVLVLAIALGGSVGLIGLWALLLKSVASRWESAAGDLIVLCAWIGLCTDVLMEFWAIYARSLEMLLALAVPAVIAVHRISLIWRTIDPHECERGGQS